MRSLSPIWYCRCTWELQPVNTALSLQAPIESGVSQENVPVSLNDREGMMTTANPRFLQNGSCVAGCDSHKTHPSVATYIASRDLQAAREPTSQRGFAR